MSLHAGALPKNEQIFKIQFSFICIALLSMQLYRTIKKSKLKEHVYSSLISYSEVTVARKNSLRQYENGTLSGTDRGLNRKPILNWVTLMSVNINNV